MKINVSFLVRNSFINEAESVIGMLFWISVHTIHTSKFIFQAEEFEILRSADHLRPWSTFCSEHQITRIYSCRRDAAGLSWFSRTAENILYRHWLLQNNRKTEHFTAHVRSSTDTVFTESILNFLIFEMIRIPFSTFFEMLSSVPHQQLLRFFLLLPKFLNTQIGFTCH